MANDDMPAMHDDDPVLGWRWLTRQRLKWLLVFLAILTMVMMFLFGYVLLREHDANEQDIHKLACLMVAPYPDTIPYVKDFRAEYGCPPYNPAIASRLHREQTQTGG